MSQESNAAEEALPFVAPCRQLAPTAPFGWLRQGWRDMWSAPRQSLTYGSIVVLLSFALAWITVELGGYWQLLSLVSGFILIAPLLAVGTYAISRQLGRGKTPSLRRCMREEQRAVGNLMVFALIVFAAAAFSLPMMVDRRVDTVTAVVTSINAVLRNRMAMAVWAACIVVAVAPGFALLFIGRERGAGLMWLMAALGITLPLIGHATWHAYRESIDAEQWPEQPDC